MIDRTLFLLIAPCIPLCDVCAMFTQSHLLPRIEHRADDDAAWPTTPWVSGATPSLPRSGCGRAHHVGTGWPHESSTRGLDVRSVCGPGGNSFSPGRLALALVGSLEWRRACDGRGGPPRRRGQRGGRAACRGCRGAPLQRALRHDPRPAPARAARRLRRECPSRSPSTSVARSDWCSSPGTSRSRPFRGGRRPTRCWPRPSSCSGGSTMPAWGSWRPQVPPGARRWPTRMDGAHLSQRRVSGKCRLPGRRGYGPAGFRFRRAG